MSQIQSVLFDKDKFTTAQARAFLKRNRLVSIKRVDKTTKNLRYMLQNPKLFKRFRIIRIKKNIQFVIGFVR